MRKNRGFLARNKQYSVEISKVYSDKKGLPEANTQKCNLNGEFAKMKQEFLCRCDLDKHSQNGKLSFTFTNPKTNVLLLRIFIVDSLFYRSSRSSLSLYTDSIFIKLNSWTPSTQIKTDLNIMWSKKTWIENLHLNILAKNPFSFSDFEQIKLKLTNENASTSKWIHKQTKTIKLNGNKN